MVAESLEKTHIAKYHNRRAGHGFAAEDANHFADILRGKQAAVVGRGNELNGADRCVNGVLIQSKYYQSPAETLSAAFDSVSGNYRYDGQVLEVPRDQHGEIVELMRDKIRGGQVPGVSDAAQAEEIVKAGSVTYKQARNIARSGTIESLKFDAQTQAVTAGSAFTVSFVVNFMQARLAGHDDDVAARAAFSEAFVAGGLAFVTGIAGAQLLRTKAAAAGTVLVRGGLKNISSTDLGRMMIEHLAKGSLGKGVYGAAAVNHAAKVMRSNAITATVAIVFTATPDFYRAIFEGSISWSQFAKNISANAAGVAGGTAGWLMGAAAGAAIGSAVPVVGTAVGGFVGGLVGSLGLGTGCSMGAKHLADQIAPDDSEEILKIVRGEIEKMAEDHLLTEEEAHSLASEVKKKINAQWLRNMYRESRHGRERARDYVVGEFKPHVEWLLSRRTKFSMPKDDVVHDAFSSFVGDLLISPAEKNAA